MLRSRTPGVCALRSTGRLSVTGSVVAGAAGLRVWDSDCHAIGCHVGVCVTLDPPVMSFAFRSAGGPWHCCCGFGRPPQLIAAAGSSWQGRSTSATNAGPAGISRAATVNSRTIKNHVSAPAQARVGGSEPVIGCRRSAKDSVDMRCRVEFDEQSLPEWVRTAAAVRPSRGRTDMTGDDS